MSEIRVANCILSMANKTLISAPFIASCFSNTKGIKLIMKCLVKIKLACNPCFSSAFHAVIQAHFKIEETGIFMSYKEFSDYEASSYKGHSSFVIFCKKNYAENLKIAAKS